MKTNSFAPLSDKKKIKIGSHWFMFKFFADGYIEKTCFEFDQHLMNQDFSTPANSCQLCDYTKENN